MSWVRFDDDGIRKETVYVHHLKAQGVCTACGTAFRVVFTKETPDGLFGPNPTFECPCGHFVFDPETKSTRVKDTSLTRDELRTAYDLAVRQRSA